MFAVLSLPSPLHPAVVHFPIVLLLLGVVVAIAAAITRRWHLPVIAAVLLVLGAAGAAIAAGTGEEEGEMVEDTVGVESVLDQHEEWAERTQTAAVIAALLAIGAVAATRWPGAARGLGITTALAGIVAAVCVATAGHYGGQLVYRHGAGINLAPTSATVEATNPDGTPALVSPAKSPRPRSEKSRKG